MAALRSTKYLAGSRGERCKFQIPGVCLLGGDTVVPAHLRDRHTGGAIKASDLSVGDGCFGCHNVMDRRAKLPSGEYISEFEWLFYALRALQDTLESRHDRGLLIVALDTSKPRTVPARKPKSELRPVPAGRPLQSRNDLRKAAP